MDLKKDHLFKMQVKTPRITDESRYPFEHPVDPVVKPRGFGMFFIKPSFRRVPQIGFNALDISRTSRGTYAVG